MHKTFGLLLGLTGLMATTVQAAPQPNILWISCEDISPSLGCFGDKYALTPNLDRLAAQGVRYTHAFSVAGVCAPSRSCLITGMYPSSLGSHHMRCSARLPETVRCFPEYLRRAGYYCSNNVKEDYNFTKPPGTWDESSNKAHWRNRKPGQPFFSVFNFVVTHESQIRAPDAAFAKQTARLTAEERHDPAKAPVPPFHPDTPAVRRDWARYYDLITAMDKLAADILKQLDEDGLADDTIVFFFSDHGVGLPRGKRWLYDTGMRVPLIVRFPPKLQDQAPGKPGTATDRLVSFVDFGPTVLNLAAVPVPEHMQGLPFLGEKASPPREYVYGIRDRMDERIDFTRAVRDQRYKYIVNYRPELPYFQWLSYMMEMPTAKELLRLSKVGKLNEAQQHFMAPTKPFEELYDTEADPHEIHNLAASPAHRQTLLRLQAAHAQWRADTIDLGFLPEAELHIRAGEKTIYDVVRQNPAAYPQRALAAIATAPNVGKPVPLLTDRLRDEDSAVRWWAVVGLGRLKGASAVEPLKKALADPSSSVRVAAAEALSRFGDIEPGDCLPALLDGLKDRNEWVRLTAAIALDNLGERARPARERMQAALKDSNQYVVRVMEHAVNGKRD